jgi:hypothetical protein
MLSSLFDEYSLNARVRPSLLALLPLVAFLYLVFPQLYGVLAGAVGIFVVFGLVTVLAHFSRSAGKTAEQGLFTDWGGRPSTIMLRHRDTFLDSVTKSRYHRFLAKNIDGWVAPSAEEELNDPQMADERYWVSACLSVLLSCWWAFVVKDTWVKDAAIGYAARLFSACEADRRK